MEQSLKKKKKKMGGYPNYDKFSMCSSLVILAVTLVTGAEIGLYPEKEINTLKSHFSSGHSKDQTFDFGFKII